MNSTNYLENIFKRKQEEVRLLIEETENNPDQALNRILKGKHSFNNHFSSSLKQTELAVIGEIKRKSPARGKISDIGDPVQLALKYCEGGCSAISVLTDKEGFNGSLDDLSYVAEAINIHYPHVSILRKDFIIHPLQLAEAVAAGAHAVLLIVNILGKNTGHMIQEAHRLGLEALTEVHDEVDLQIALEANAPIIGINHRNLNTFEINLGISDILRPKIPSYVMTVSESGIQQASQAKYMHSLGYDAVLIGEALVRSKDPISLIKKMKGVS